MKLDATLLPVRRIRDGAVVLTPAKLNLFLEVEGRRDDGFHDVTTLLAAVHWHDRLVVREGSGEDRLSVHGVEVPAGPENLVRRAVERLRREVPVPPLHMELTKRIPPGAGLGGGSGNAAGALWLLRQWLHPELTLAAIIQIATDLGSDVPFFFEGGMAVGRGRGDRLTPLAGPSLGGDRPTFLVVVPSVPSGTAEAYRSITFPLTSPDGPISFHEKTFVTSREWVAGLFNRFERPVLESLKVLQPLADWLSRRAPGRACMTGSGSAFFVVCSEPGEAEQLASQLRDELRGALQPAAICVVRGNW